MTGATNISLNGPSDAAEPKADASAWLAVAAGTLGAFMATLDISIVNSSLPTIQGEIGASGTEGTWIATAYLVAEIVIIPLAAWLERLLGLRALLLLAASLFTLFSVMCGLSTGLMMMVIGRIGQGFTGGAMIPTAQTIIATRLPRKRQPIGTAMFGATVIMGPVLGPLIGGWLTENVSWHYAFFLNVPICAALITLLIAGLEHEPIKLNLLPEADWLGIAGLTLGLGGVTVLLEEGQREQWFSSSLIQGMAFVSATGLVLLLVGQMTAIRPVIKLRLLLDRQFGAVALMGVLLGVVLYGTAYVIPQFLSAIAGYDALQSGQVVLLSGIPSLALMVVLPLMIRTLDIRLAVATSLLIMSASSFLDSHLTANSDGSSFVVSQLMRGVGQILGMLFLNQAVVQSVGREDAGDAAGLFNSFRNLGGSIALASLSVVQEQRMWLHARRIEDSLNSNSMAVQSYVGNLTLNFDRETALKTLGQQIQQQALVITYNDVFVLLTYGTLLVLPLVFFLRPLSSRMVDAGH